MCKWKTVTKKKRQSEIKGKKEHVSDIPIRGRNEKLITKTKQENRTRTLKNTLQQFTGQMDQL